jgi:hypothetical protein
VFIITYFICCISRIPFLDFFGINHYSSSYVLQCYECCVELADVKHGTHKSFA